MWLSYHFKRSVDTEFLLWNTASRAKLYAECNDLKDPFDRAWNVVIAKRYIQLSAALYRVARQRELINETMEKFK